MGRRPEVLDVTRDRATVILTVIVIMGLLIIAVRYGSF